MRTGMGQRSKSLGRSEVRSVAERLKTSNTARHFGFVLLEAGPEAVAIGMRVAKRHLQVHGVVHGGVLASLADTAGGLAVYFRLPQGSRVATVEMKINYLEPVERGGVRAHARVIRLGKNLGVVDCDVIGDANRLVGKALMTFAVIHRGEKQKRRRRR
ncbi:MAG: PaaI family thioesterase [Candidatus Acidiferrales bacterium]